MRKLTLFFGVLFFVNLMYSQDVKLGSGENNWILHAPNDTRKSIFIAPKKTDGSNNYDWIKQTIFKNTGEVLFQKYLGNDPNLAIDWNTLWQNGFFESTNGLNAPESTGWFWGLNMNHRSNHADYRYNGQIVIKNSSTLPTMYFRSTNRDGVGTWAKVLHEKGNQNIEGNLKSKAITLDGANPIASVNGFVNKISLTGSAHGAVVFKPGSTKELMFGMHDNGHFYWGTGRNATKKDYYSMSLNGSTGELQPKSIHLKGKVNGTSGWGETKFGWDGHSLIMGSKPGTYAHNVIEMKPGGADQGQLLSAFKMHHANSKTDHDLRVNIDSRKTSPTYFDVGNVGIGTRDPKNKLSVNGTIWAKEVKVRLTDAADWVFEPTYTLRPLAEVAAFIEKNKHLPEIPSAEEFRANDMEVSEMTNKLLQKIEELTLYTIEQEEKIKTQEERLQKLEALLLNK